MLIKLAAFTKEEEDKIRKNLSSPSSVRSKIQLLNFAHPATILGGSVGGFAGSELGDRLFGGHHAEEIYKPMMVTKTKRFWGLIPKNETIFKKMTTKTPGMSSRLAKNIFRGSMGSLGAGLGALAVNSYRNREKKDAR